MLHLASLNPLVAAALTSSSASAAARGVGGSSWAASISRCPAPGPSGVASGALAGVSAFAFQGTNAHVLVSRAPESLPLSSSSSPFLWHRARHWPVPIRSALLSSVAIVASIVSFKVPLGEPRLAVLCSGAGCCSGLAAEAAAAAAHAALMLSPSPSAPPPSEQPPPVHVLTRLAFSSSSFNSNNLISLSVSLDLRKGAITVGGEQQPKKKRAPLLLSASVATMAAAAAAATATEGVSSPSSLSLSRLWRSHSPLSLPARDSFSAVAWQGDLLSSSAAAASRELGAVAGAEAALALQSAVSVSGFSSSSSRVSSAAVACSRSGEISGKHEMHQLAIVSGSGHAIGGCLSFRGVRLSPETRKKVVSADETSYRVRWVSREPPSFKQSQKNSNRETWLVLAPSAVPPLGSSLFGGSEERRDVVVAVRRPSSSSSVPPSSSSSFVASLLDNTDSCPLSLSNEAHARLLLDSAAGRCSRLLAVQPPPTSLPSVSASSPSSSAAAFDLLWAFRAVALRARLPEAASLPPMATISFDREGSSETVEKEGQFKASVSASSAAVTLAKTLRMEARRAAGPAVVLPWPLSRFEASLLPVLTEGVWASDESALAVRRGGRVFAERLCAAPLAAPVSSQSSSSSSLRNRTAIVFGGTRGLGLELAISCAQDRGASALVLASREPTLRREDLERLAALPSSSSSSSSPLVVVVARVDASDAAASAQLLSWAREELPPVGVVGHAAGGISHAELCCLSEDEASAVAAPKLAAAELMIQSSSSSSSSSSAAATAEHLCFSSTAVAWSQPGSGHYAAANAALAAAAAAAASRGTAASAPRLGPFGGARGMAAAHTGSIRALGLCSMPPGSVARLLGSGIGKGAGISGLTSDDAPVAVVIDRRRFREVNTVRGAWRFLDDLETVECEKKIEEKEAEEEPEQGAAAAATAVPLRRRRERRCREAAALAAAPSASSPSSPSPLPLLSLESVASTIASVAVHVSGFPLPASGNLVGGEAGQGGLDSLGAVEFARGVTAALRLPAPPLPPTLAFDHPTVESAARHVHSLLVARLQQQRGASATVMTTVAEEEEEGEAESDEEEAIPLPPLSLSLPLPLRRRSAAFASPPTLAVAAVSERLPGQHPKTLDSCSVVPVSRWDADARRAHGPARALRHAHWFSGGDGDDFFASFDSAAFGGISPPEVEALDPQQRLLLQGAAEVINDGNGGLLRRHAAVFVGIQQMEYGNLAARCSPSSVGAHAATGTPFSVSAGRVSFTFGLCGPAVAVDTACSSALVGVHLAGRFVRERVAEEEEKEEDDDAEIDVSISTPSSSSSPPPSSIAAGVNLLLSASTTAIAQMAGMLCGDARCKSMDASADGYGRAEACVVLLLTAAASASASASTSSSSSSSASVPSPPLALIAATAINQDGRSASLTAPSGPAQAAVMRSALRGAAAASSRRRQKDEQSGNADGVVALEMHGTGTPLGDPIEVGAAAGVLCTGKENGENALRLTAAKTRLGHSEPVAGAVGLLFAVAGLGGLCSLPVAHLRAPSPHVSAALEAAVAGRSSARQLSVPRAACPLVVAGEKKSSSSSSPLSGVSSFAFQGTNAHVILERTTEAADALFLSRFRLPLRGSRAWFAPPTHHLLFRASVLASSSSSPLVEFALPSLELCPSVSYLRDHVVSRRPLLPAAAMVEACTAAARCAAATAVETASPRPPSPSPSSAAVVPAALALVGISLMAPCWIPMQKQQEKQRASSSLRVLINLQSGGAELRSASSSSVAHLSARAAAVAVAAATTATIPAAAASSALLLPSRRRLPSLQLLPSAIGSVLSSPSGKEQQPGGYWCHPASLDAATHVAAALSGREGQSTKNGRVPVAIACFCPFRPSPSSLSSWATVQVEDLRDGDVGADFAVVGDGNGNGNGSGSGSGNGSGNGTTRVAGFVARSAAGLSSRAPAATAAEKKEEEATAAAAAHMRYTVVWQAEEPLALSSSSSPSLLRLRHRRRRGAAASLRFFTSSVTRTTTITSTRVLEETAAALTAVAWARRAAAAATTTTLRLETAGGVPLPALLASPAGGGQRDGGSGAASSSAASSSSMWGVLRCATQEIPRSSWQSVERSPLLREGDSVSSSASESGEEDAFGSGRASGARLVPRVLPVAEAAPLSPQSSASSDSSLSHLSQHVCVTGGGGGLGLLFARWAVAASAASRSSSSIVSLVDSVPIRALPLELTSSLSSLVVASTRDVATSAGTAAASFSYCPSSSLSSPTFSSPPTLLLHAAGTLRDSLLQNQTPRNFREVFSGKVHGAKRALSSASSSTRLPPSVLFSSVSALVAPPGQSNYAAANGALNSLATRGAGAGLPVLAAQWGAWGGKGLGGMAESNDLLPRVRAAGLGIVGAAAGVSALEASLPPLLLAPSAPSSSSSSSSCSLSFSPEHQLLSPFDWPRLMARAPTVSPAFAEYAPFWHAEQERRKKKELVLLSSTSSSKAAAAAVVFVDRPQRKQRLQKLQQQRSRRAASADSAAARDSSAATGPSPLLRSRVAASVRAAVARALGFPVADDRAPLMDSGLDSMAAVSLRAGLAAVLSLESGGSDGSGSGGKETLGEDSLPVTVAFDYPTTAALTDFLVSLLSSSSASSSSSSFSSSSPSSESNQQKEEKKEPESEEEEFEEEELESEEREEEESEEEEGETAEVIAVETSSSSSSPPSSSLVSRFLPLVLEAARRTLGADETPSPDAPLMSLGLDSAGALELRAALARVAAGVSSGSSAPLELSATFAFDHPTPAAMASALAELCGSLEHEVREIEAPPKTAAKKRRPPPLRSLPRPSPPRSRLLQPRRCCGSPAVAVLSVAARLPTGKIDSSPSGEPSDPISATRPLFAGADDLSAPTPLARFDADEYYAPRGFEEAARTNLTSASDCPPHRHAGLTLYARCAALVDALELFDWAAFGLSPAEAAATDPQCRQLLETAGSALLSVSSSPSSSSSSSSSTSFFSSPLVRSRTAVFTGSMFQEHTQLQYDAGEKGASASPAVATGNGISYLCGRVSFAFGLQGACVATDTACSASLVAAHLAFRALTTGNGSGGSGNGKNSPPSPSSSSFDADAAIVGGVNALLLPITTCTISGLQALSPEGRCKTFDASADGYGRGEGFLAAVLCREADVPSEAFSPSSSSSPSGISPLALLVASAVGQDGRSSSLTAPSGPAQAALIRGVVASASASAAPSSSSISSSPSPLLLPALVATHGTGTPLGDPIELGALSSALLPPQGEDKGTRGRSTALAAPKASFGHTEGAAGLGGLVAAAAALRSRCAPPTPSVRSLNPYVSAALGDWERKGRRSSGSADGGGAVARSLAPLLLSQPAAEREAPPHSPLLAAATSSFGMSGTNAHALLSVSKEASLMPLAYLPLGDGAWRRSPLWPVARPPPGILAAVVSSSLMTATFEVRLSGVPSLAWLKEHAVARRAILPATASLELLSAAARLSRSGSVGGGGGGGDGLLALTSASLSAPLPLDDNDDDSNSSPLVVSITLDAAGGRSLWFLLLFRLHLLLLLEAEDAEGPPRRRRRRRTSEPARALCPFLLPLPLLFLLLHRLLLLPLFRSERAPAPTLLILLLRRLSPSSRPGPSPEGASPSTLRPSTPRCTWARPSSRAPPSPSPSRPRWPPRRSLGRPWTRGPLARGAAGPSLGRSRARRATTLCCCSAEEAEEADRRR